MVLLDGEVDLSMGGFGVGLETELSLVFVKEMREPIDSNSSFSVILTPRTVLATLETSRHMLDFRSSMSCFGFG